MTEIKFDYEVSVIIPARNIEKCIKRSITSVLEQDIGLSSIQLIIIDDGSTDSTGSIAEAFSKKYINVEYYHQQNRGLSAARNAAVNLARGKYLLFLDGDDVITPGLISRAVKLLEHNYAEIDSVYFPIERIINNREISDLGKRFDFFPTSGVYDLRNFAHMPITFTPQLTKNLGENNYLFDERVTAAEDQLYNLKKLMNNPRVGILKNEAYLYISRKESLITANNQYLQGTKNFEQVVNSMLELRDMGESEDRLTGELVMRQLCYVACSPFKTSFFLGSKPIDGFNDYLEICKKAAENIDKKMLVSANVCHPKWASGELLTLCGYELRSEIQNGTRRLFADNEEVFSSSEAIALEIIRLKMSNAVVSFTAIFSDICFSEKDELIAYVQSDKKAPVRQQLKSYIDDKLNTKAGIGFKWCFDFEAPLTDKPLHLSFMLKFKGESLKVKPVFISSRRGVMPSNMLYSQKRNCEAVLNGNKLTITKCSKIEAEVFKLSRLLFNPYYRKAAKVRFFGLSYHNAVAMYRAYEICGIRYLKDEY